MSNEYECGNCSFKGECYGTLVGDKISVPWCPKCGINNQLKKVNKMTQPENELMPKLDNCPFCDSQPEMLTGYNREYVQCPNKKCWLYGAMARPKEWNTRAPIGDKNDG